MRIDFDEYVQRAQQGDERAMESVIRAFRRIGCRKYKHKFDQDLEDAMQTGLMKLWQGIKDFNPTKTDNAFMWLFMTLDHGISDYIKQKNRRKYSVLNNALSLNRQINYRSNEDGRCITLEDIIPSDIVIEDIVYDVYGKQQYKKLVRILSPIESKVLHCRYFGGLRSLKLIAQITGVHFKAADNAMSRIKRKAKYLGIGAIV
jgi:RNA polymerase sporulation-specific sigma factor